MKIAVIILATGEYWRGAKVLVHTLRKHGNLPDSVDCIVMGMESCDFAQGMAIKHDYSWVPVSQANFPKVADKFFALTLDYDRIILMDADVMCVGDCSYLWSDNVGSLSFYACRDTGSVIYYADVIQSIGMDPNLLFNAGVMIFHRVDVAEILSLVGSGDLKAYDGGDQGYLNHYFQHIHPRRAGWLPPEFNCCLDIHMPRLPDHAQRLIHFCGPNANPWNPYDMNPYDWRADYFRQWTKMWEEVNQ